MYIHTYVPTYILIWTKETKTCVLLTGEDRGTTTVANGILVHHKSIESPCAQQFCFSIFTKTESKTKSCRDVLRPVC